MPQRRSPRESAESACRQKAGARWLATRTDRNGEALASQPRAHVGRKPVCGGLPLGLTATLDYRCATILCTTNYL